MSCVYMRICMISRTYVIEHETSYHIILYDCIIYVCMHFLYYAYNQVCGWVGEWVGVGGWVNDDSLPILSKPFLVEPLNVTERVGVDISLPVSVTVPCCVTDGTGSSSSPALVELPSVCLGGIAFPGSKSDDDGDKSFSDSVSDGEGDKSFSDDGSVGICDRYLLDSGSDDVTGISAPGSRGNDVDVASISLSKGSVWL